MYTEEPRKNINWGNILKKGLIVIAVAAVILLVIWLFTKDNNTSNGINVDYNGNTNVNENIERDDTYSEVFIDNYRYFHDTAKEYFLISKLPEKGETIKFTLQELIDMKLILSFGYTGNEVCDTEASYVTVKNIDGKYTMTTTLVCGTEVASTTEELGCNQICEENIDCDYNCDTPTDDKDDEEVITGVTEYQYKQAYTATETVSTCDTKNGYKMVGTGSSAKCVKASSDTKSPTKTVDVYCLNGKEPDSNGNCPTTETTYVPVKTKTTTYCENGETPTSKGCPSTSTTYTSVETRTVEYCANGATPTSKGCPVITTVYEEPLTNTSTYCENGATPTSKGCPVTSTTYVAAQTKYTCSKGDLVNEKYCRIYSTSSSYKSYTTYMGTTYQGCKYSGSYTGACTSYTGCTRTYYKYYCTSSSYNDVAANPTQYCTNGATPTSKGCPVTTTTYEPVQTRTTEYCANSENPTSKGCPVTKTTYDRVKTRTIEYCTNGEDPTSRGCPSTKTTYEKVKTNTTTYCTNGATPTSKGCPVTTSSTSKAIKNTMWKCDSGYTKIGIGSTAICTKGKTITANPTTSTKQVTKYRYKWSTETSLEGWTRTGQTRQTATISNTSSK